MFSIFYDLETSDKNPIGQILNYCFILVDDSFGVLDELSGEVRLSRLQLPDCGAILANRINVLELQSSAEDSEYEALGKIVLFIGSCIERARGAVSFIGYNSSRFDLNYLRTSLIRNGFNPYFGGKLPARDLLHGVQKAYLTFAPFRERIRAQREGEPRLSLSLETVSHALGLLSGVQAHESREDVLLTIKLAAWLKENAGINISTLDAYEGLKLHSTARSGSVYLVSEPQYDLLEDGFVSLKPVTLLDADKRSALWIDLQRYAENPTPVAIFWRSAAKHPFYTTGHAKEDSYLKGLARGALEQFRGTTLGNFFKKSTCDIEMDIYRLDFDGVDALREAILAQSKAPLEALQRGAEDAKILWIRHQLALPGARVMDERFASMLRRYAAHRYGGKLQLSKNIEGDGRPEDFHPTYSTLLRNLNQARDAAFASANIPDSRSAEDIALLNALEGYYQSSDLLAVAAAEIS